MKINWTNKIKGILHQSIDEHSLLWAMKVLQKVEAPNYVPYFEGVTRLQAANYFKIPEKKIRYLLANHKVYFRDNYSVVSGKEIEAVAILRENSDVYSDSIYEFSNGLRILASRTANTMLNARALLHLALYLNEESIKAIKVSELLYGGLYAKTLPISDRQLPSYEPWFKERVSPITHDDTTEYAVEDSEVEPHIETKIQENKTVLSAGAGSLADVLKTAFGVSNATVNIVLSN